MLTAVAIDVWIDDVKMMTINKFKVSNSRSYAGYFLAYTTLAILLFSAVWKDPMSRWIGIQGDANSFMWFLSWIPYELIHFHNPLMTNYLMFPRGINLMWNTSIIIPAIVLSPITLIFGPVFSFNILSTLSLSVSAFVAFVAINSFIQKRSIAFIGGLIYGFSPYMIAQSIPGHVNLTFVWYPPMVLFLINYLIIRKSSKRWTIGVALGIFTAIEILTAEEIVATTAMAGGILLVLLSITYREKVKDRFLYSIGPLVLGGFIALVLVAYPLYIQFFGIQVVHGPLQTKNVFVTDLANLVVPTPFLHFYPPWAGSIVGKFTGNNGEWDGYIGIPWLLFLVIVPFVMRRNILIRLASIFSLIITIFSFGPQLHIAGKVLPFDLPWYEIQKLPLLDNVLPSRLMNLVFLSSALVTSVVLKYLIEKYKSKGIVAAGVLVMICFYPLLPAFKYPYQTNLTPKFFTTNAVKQIPSKSVALVAPSGLTFLPELWQAEAKFRYKMPSGSLIVPNPNGIGALSLPNVSALLFELFVIQQGYVGHPLTSKKIVSLRQNILQDKIQTVIVGPFYSGPPTAIQLQGESKTKNLFIALLKHNPQYEKGVYIWKNVPELITHLKTN